MNPAPRGATSTRAAFTLLELLAVLVVLAILTGILIGGGRRAAEAGNTARTKSELAVLATALEAYKRAYGDYPRTGEVTQLVQALIGRKGPANRDLANRSLLETARFAFANSADPFVNPVAVLVDHVHAVALDDDQRPVLLQRTQLRVGVQVVRDIPRRVGVAAEAA